MSLKKSIVIKNEYTNNANSKKGKGSRGASPGAYVMRYMAREDATEPLSPLSSYTTLKTDFNSSIFTRYMTRLDATEKLKNKEDLEDLSEVGSPLMLKHKFKKKEKLSGRAFGSSGISLSDDDLKNASDSIQQAFDAGHSVQKIVLSFTEEYLKETGVLDKDFKYKGKGSYKGHIDQLKLRSAISRGVNKMTKEGKYEAPVWVGTLQFDTGNVHSHIALVDKEFSSSRIMDDGADRGKIYEREKKSLRLGINHELEDLKDLKTYNKRTSLERQNVVSFVKDYCYSVINESTPIKNLMNILPKNRKDWRYGSNNKDMKEPNRLSLKIVTDLFKDEPEKSGFKKAEKAVLDYSKEKQKVDRLTDEDTENVIKKGYGSIIERSINGLYKTIKSYKDKKYENTKFTGSDYFNNMVMVNEDEPQISPLTYKRRISKVKEKSDNYSDKCDEYFNLLNDSDTDSSNGDIPLNVHLFYEEELSYNMKLADKYNSFFAFSNYHNDKLRKDRSNKHNKLFTKYKNIENDDDKNNYKKELRKYTYDGFKEGTLNASDWDGIIKKDEKSVETLFVEPPKPKDILENFNYDYIESIKLLDIHKITEKTVDEDFGEFLDCLQKRDFACNLAFGSVDTKDALKDINKMKEYVEKLEKEGILIDVQNNEEIEIKKQKEDEEKDRINNINEIIDDDIYY